MDEVADEVAPAVIPKMHRWEASFDQAMRSKQNWKQGYQSRVQRQAPAQPPVQGPPPRDRDTRADDLGTAPSNEALVAQLREERERLAALLPRFERQQRRIVQLEEQPALDLAEELQEEQRAAMTARAKELRECRRKEQEAREREEQLRREREEEERMRAQIYEQYQAEKRRLEEQRLKEREDERRVHEEMERLKQRAWEDEQRRAEERERAYREEQNRITQERGALREQRAAVMESAFDVLEEALHLSQASGVCACCGRLLDASGAASSRCQSCVHTPDSAARPPQAAAPAAADLGASLRSRSGNDWMARALGALGDESDEESGSDLEGGGEAAAGQADGAPADEVAADVELLRVTEALVDTISNLHAEPK